MLVFGREFRVPLRGAVGRGPGSGRAISAQSTFRAAVAAHSRAKIRKYGGISARFRRPENSCGRIEGLLTYLIPHYIREGKSYLTIAFGCTGGKHRSVMLAEAVEESR